MVSIRFLSLITLITSLSPVLGDFNLTILHTNDVHARFQSFNRLTGDCTQEDISAKTCWGGAARRLTAVKKIRNEEPNIVFVDGGDQFQGSIWFTAFKAEPLSKYMNLMQYDAIALGNHEFDVGLTELAMYLGNITSTVVSSNIRDKGSAIKELFKNALIKEISGEKVGIIGYTTIETPDLATIDEELQFLDEIESLRIQVNELHKQNVTKIIAIGHSGIGVDRKICQTVHGVDVVIGGHTNTFLYNGLQPSTEVPEGPYPDVFTDTGAPCLVVQAYAFGKYLGKLKITFNDMGVPIKWDDNNPILIDSRFDPDPEMEAMLNPYESQLDHYRKSVIGQTAVAIHGSYKICRLKECNLGNIFTDASVWYYVEKTRQHLHHHENREKFWSPVTVSIANSGSIRDLTISTWWNITLENLYTALPFENTLENVQLKGEILRKAFEHSVSEYSQEEAHGRFLQVSGIRVVYDISKPKGSRVVSVHVRCSECQVPHFQPLNESQIYHVVMNSYLASGGDGFSVIKENILGSDHSEALEVNVISDYIKRMQPLVTGLENRIRFLDQRDKDKCNRASKIVCNLLIFVIFALMKM